MCGLSAIFGKNSQEFAKIKGMTDLLHHRGPDNKKIVRVNSNLVLGHNRLKIIDLSKKADQPFKYKNITLIFNGMIYNYIELKKEIPENVYKFKTNSDTEVILASYLIWGNKCFEKLRGMFSIIIWDDRKKKLLCVRDRLGIKPLYYLVDKKNIYISSEVTPLLRIRQAKPDDETVWNYLKFSLYEYKEKTFFKNIKQFQPSIINEISLDLSIKKFNYWNLFEIAKKNEIDNLDKRGAYEELCFLLDDIAKIYSRSDVKNASFLSSGLDSQVLVNLIHQYKKISLLLSFGYFSNYKDELSSIKKTESITNIEHKKIKFSKDEFLFNLSLIQKEQEMPWGGANVFFMSKMLKYASKKKFKVIYSGDGADVIFGGYDKYLFPITKSLNRYSPKNFNTHNDATTTDTKNILVKNFDKYYNDKNIYLRLPCKTDIHNSRFVDISTSKLPRNFRFSDRYSMHNSSELRFPFLDHKLIEFSYKIPPYLMINKSNNKILLRSRFSGIPCSKKMHINSPLTDWISSKQFKIYINKILNNSPLFSKYYDYNLTKNFIQNFYKKKQNNSFKIWQFVNLDLWFKTYF